jgi:phage tail-like protein
MPTGLIDTKVATPTSKSAMNKMGQTLATAATGAVTTAAVAYGIRTLEKALGLRFDPAPTYLFFVELSGVIVGLFTECGGLKIERDTDKVVEGGTNNHVHYLPGRVKQSSITLKRGLSISRALWDWMQQGRHDFKAKRINFSIIQGAPGHNLASAIAGAAGMGTDNPAYTVLSKGFGKVKHWDIENAFPVKWEISNLNAATNNTVVIETMEIVHHGLTLSYEVGTPMSMVAGASDLISF